MTKSTIPQFQFAPLASEFNLRGELLVQEHFQKVHRHFAAEIPLFVDRREVETGRAIIAGEMKMEAA